MCGLRSAIQICSAVTVSFHMEYLCAKANIARHPWCWRVDERCKIIESLEIQSFSIYKYIYIYIYIYIIYIYIYIYIYGTESIGMKKLQFAFDGFELVDPSHWHISFDEAAHTSGVCISSKVKIFCSLSVNLGVHMFGS